MGLFWRISDLLRASSHPTEPMCLTWRDRFRVVSRVASKLKILHEAGEHYSCLSPNTVVLGRDGGIYLEDVEGIGNPLGSTSGDIVDFSMFMVQLFLFSLVKWHSSPRISAAEQVYGLLLKQPQFQVAQNEKQTPIRPFSRDRLYVLLKDIVASTGLDITKPSGKDCLVRFARLLTDALCANESEQPSIGHLLEAIKSIVAEIPPNSTSTRDSPQTDEVDQLGRHIVRIKQLTKTVAPVADNIRIYTVNWQSGYESDMTYMPPAEHHSDRKSSRKDSTSAQLSSTNTSSSNRSSTNTAASNMSSTNGSSRSLQKTEVVHHRKASRAEEMERMAIGLSRPQRFQKTGVPTSRPSSRGDMGTLERRLTAASMNRLSKQGGDATGSGTISGTGTLKSFTPVALETLEGFETAFHDLNSKRGTVAPPSPGECVKHFTKQERIGKEEAMALVIQAQKVMKSEPNVLELKAPQVVVGDLHGQFFDLLSLFDLAGFPGSKAFATQKKESWWKAPKVGQQFLFLGDYVDRGAWSTEVLLFLLSLKVAHPTQVHLLRGNHETEAVASYFGFRDECESKYGKELYLRCLSCFQSMPIAATIDTDVGRLFCCHGGISPNITSLSVLEEMDRFREPGLYGALCDLLWSDPVKLEDLAVKPLNEDEEEGMAVLHGNSKTPPSAQDRGPRRRSRISAADHAEMMAAETSPEQIRVVEVTQDVTNSSVSKSSLKMNAFKHLDFLPNPVRGCSYRYGYHAVETFLQANNLIGMIRAHEVQPDGFQINFQRPDTNENNGKNKSHSFNVTDNNAPFVVTVFSAPNYCGRYGNRAAYVTVGNSRGKGTVSTDARASKETHGHRGTNSAEDNLKKHGRKHSPVQQANASDDQDGSPHEKLKRKSTKTNSMAKLLNIVTPCSFDAAKAPEPLPIDNETAKNYLTIEQTCPYMPTTLNGFIRRAIALGDLFGSASDRMQTVQTKQAKTRHMRAFSRLRSGTAGSHASVSSKPGSSSQKSGPRRLGSGVRGFQKSVSQDIDDEANATAVPQKKPRKLRTLRPNKNGLKRSLVKVMAMQAFRAKSMLQDSYQTAKSMDEMNEMHPVLVQEKFDMATNRLTSQVRNKSLSAKQMAAVNEAIKQGSPMALGAATTTPTPKRGSVRRKKSAASSSSLDAKGNPLFEKNGSGSSSSRKSSKARKGSRANKSGSHNRRSTRHQSPEQQSSTTQPKTTSQGSTNPRFSNKPSPVKGDTTKPTTKVSKSKKSSKSPSRRRKKKTKGTLGSGGGMFRRIFDRSGRKTKPTLWSTEPSTSPESDEAIRLLLDWVNTFVCESRRQKPVAFETFYQDLGDGILLCTIMEKIKGSKLDGFIHSRGRRRLNEFQKLENLIKFQDACTQLGMTFGIDAEAYLSGEVEVLVPCLLELAKIASVQSELRPNIPSNLLEKSAMATFGGTFQTGDSSFASKFKAKVIKSGLDESRVKGLPLSFSQQELLALRLLYLMIDRNNDGRISKLELLHWSLNDGSQAISAHEAELCIKAVDADGDGVIGLQDFLLFAAQNKELWVEDQRTDENKPNGAAGVNY